MILNTHQQKHTSSKSIKREREEPRSEVEERPPRPPAEEAEAVAGLAALSSGNMEVEAKVAVLEPRKSWNKSLSCCSFSRRRESTSSLLLRFVILFNKCFSVVATSPPLPSFTVCSLRIISWTHSTRKKKEREREIRVSVFT